MSKDIITLKFRPQDFSEFIGQPQVSNPIINSFKTGNLHHAYLFYGPRGCGKTSAARILAKMFNCTENDSIHPCNNCETCEEISKGISPDVIEIDGASNRGINEIRDLQENIRFAPARSKYKVYIIDEVHMLTKEAFNALLKTLEEPPSHVIFIFATTEVHKILPTIRSRCQQYQFQLFNLNDLKKQIIKILEFYNIEYEDKAINWISKYAYGSMRDAQSILSQIIAYNNEQIKEEDVLTTLGIQPFEIVVELFDQIYKKDLKSIFNISYKLYLSGIELSNFIQQMVDFLRNINLINNGIDNIQILQISRPQLDILSKFKNTFTTKQITMMIEKLAEFSKNMQIYNNSYPYFENLLISFAFYENFIYPSDIIKNINQTKKALSNYIEEKDYKNIEIDINKTPNAESKSNPSKTNNHIEEDTKSYSDNKVTKKDLLKEDIERKENNKKAGEKDNSISQDLLKSLKFDEEKIETSSKIEAQKNIEEKPKKKEIKKEDIDNKKKENNDLNSKLNYIKEVSKNNFDNLDIPQDFKKIAEVFQGEYTKED